MTLEQVRKMKRAAVAARPLYHGCNDASAEAAWGKYYDVLYRLETEAMKREQDEFLKSKQA
jgi:hypothetical protein